MGSRRRNLIILALVGVMLVVSSYVIATKPTVLGLDLRGGTELVYQGRPTPQNPEIQGDDIDRAIEIIRERTDKLGVSEPEISRVGTDQIRIGLPDVANAERAAEQVGTTSQLYFYDWEPNVIRPPNVQSDYTERGINRLYDAVVFASKQKPECFEDECTTTGPTYYMFDKNTKQLAAGPASTQSDLLLNKNSLPPPADREVIAVPQGTVVVQQEATPDDPNTDEDESDSPRATSSSTTVPSSPAMTSATPSRTSTRPRTSRSSPSISPTTGATSSRR